MVNKVNEHIADGLGLSLSAFLTATQTNELFRTISLILTILATLVVLARNIYDWYIKAKEDKKIDKEEVKDLIDIVGDAVEDISDSIKKDKKDGDK